MALGLAVLFWYLLVYVAHATNLAAYPYDLDQGEAYDVNSGWLIAQGRPIYTDNSTYTYYSSNYPPVYSLLLAPIVAQTGPTLASGRLLSVAATLLSALLMACIVGAQTRSGLAGFATGLLYLGSTYVFHTTPLARVNGMAVLFAVGGLACCLGRRWPSYAGVVVLFLLALFTKQTTVDAVGAGLLALLLRDVAGRDRSWRSFRGRDFPASIVVGLLIGVLGCALLLALNVATGGAFWLNVVVGNVNPFDAWQAIVYFQNFLQIHLVVVGLAGWQVYRQLRARQIGPFELYWVFSLLLAVSVGKWGAGESYFLAPIAASAVLAGQAVARLLAAGATSDARLVLLGGLLLVQGGLYAHGPFNQFGPWFVDRGAQAAVLSRWPGPYEVQQAADLVEILAKAEGPVLLEDPSYGLALGKEVVGNATHLRNVYLAGVWSPDNLVADLRERRYAWVVLNAELYPAPVLEAIGRYYYLYEVYEINGTRQQLFAPGEQ